MTEPTHFEKVVSYVMSNDRSELDNMRAERDYCLHCLEREIEIAHRAQVELANERERCIAVCESWIGTFQKFDPKRIGARNYAVDAIEDIIEVIREGTDPRAALDKDAV